MEGSTPEKQETPTRSIKKKFSRNLEKKTTSSESTKFSTQGLTKVKKHSLKESFDSNEKNTQENQVTIEKFDFKTQIQPVKLPKLLLPGIKKSSSSISIFKVPAKSSNYLKSLYQYYKEVDNTPKKKKNIIGNNSPKHILSQIYKLNTKYLKRKKEIKNNSVIASRKDFNLDDYQNMLVEFTGISTRKDLVGEMQKNMDKIKKMYALSSEKIIKRQKSRWEILSEKIEKHAPKFLLDKLNDLTLERYSAIEKRNRKIVKKVYAFQKCIIK